MQRYLEITFRKGKPVAAYLYLTDDQGEKSQRSEEFGSGLVLDFDQGDELVGIEITSPASMTVDSVNDALQRHHMPLIASDELSPLVAA